jgi:hypothetical protein
VGVKRGQRSSRSTATLAISELMDQAASAIQLQYGQCPTFKRAELEALQRESGYGKLAAATEDEWCEADLMYSLLTRPSIHLNRVLAQCHAMMEIKNAPDIQRSSIARDSWALLMRAGNWEVKLFYFLFMLHREPEVQEMMRRGYLLEHPGNERWGARAVSHFADFLVALEPMIKATLHWPCSDANICEVVHNLVNAARLAYAIK